MARPYLPGHPSAPEFSDRFRTFPSPITIGMTGPGLEAVPSKGGDFPGVG